MAHKIEKDAHVFYYLFQFIRELITIQLFFDNLLKVCFPQFRQILTKVSGKYGKSDLHQICFSCLFKYFYYNQNKYACITIFMVWNQVLFCYAISVNLMLCGSRNPATFKMGLFSKIVSGWKPVTIAAQRYKWIQFLWIQYFSISCGFVSTNH